MTRGNSTATQPPSALHAFYKTLGLRWTLTDVWMLQKSAYPGLSF